MKIAIIAHGVNDQSLLGGPGRVAAEHAYGLARAGHAVRVFTSNLVWKGQHVDRPTFALLGDDGISVRWTNAFSVARWPGSLGPVLCLGGSEMVAEAVKWADVVHCHEWPHGLVQAARRVSRRHGSSFVVQPHGSIQIRPPGLKNLSHRLFNYGHRLTSHDHFIAGTRREAAQIRELLGVGAPIFLLGNHVSPPSLNEDDEKVTQRRASWGFPRTSTVILFAHRIAPSKGLDILIRALPYLPGSYCLVVVGQDGGFSAYSAECRAIVHELGLGDRVRFFGPVGRTEVDEVILAGDLFVLPARHDIFPLMVMHALACRRPVVMSNGCQSAEELEDAAVIVDAHPAAIAEAIASLTPDKVRVLGASASALMADRYTAEAVVENLESIYSQIMCR